MGGHVVGAFGSMPVCGFSCGYEAFKEVSEVECDIRIRVFLHDQRAGGVLNEDGENAVG